VRILRCNTPWQRTQNGLDHFPLVGSSICWRAIGRCHFYDAQRKREHAITRLGCADGCLDLAKRAQQRLAHHLKTVALHNFSAIAVCDNHCHGLHGYFKLLQSLIQLKYTSFKLTYSSFKPTYCSFKPTYCSFKLTYCSSELTYCLSKLTCCSFKPTYCSFKPTCCSSKLTCCSSKLTCCSSKLTCCLFTRITATLYVFFPHFSALLISLNHRFSCFAAQFFAEEGKEC
jgi:hypothetical protein